MVALAQSEAVNDAPRQYLNRLSGPPFCSGRVLNRAGGRGDVLWQEAEERLRATRAALPGSPFSYQSTFSTCPNERPESARRFI